MWCVKELFIGLFTKVVIVRLVTSFPPTRFPGSPPTENIEHMLSNPPLATSDSDIGIRQVVYNHNHAVDKTSLYFKKSKSKSNKSSVWEFKKKKEKYYSIMIVS